MPVLLSYRLMNINVILFKIGTHTMEYLILNRNSKSPSERSLIGFGDDLLVTENGEDGAAEEERRGGSTNVLTSLTLLTDEEERRDWMESRVIYPSLQFLCLSNAK